MKTASSMHPLRMRKFEGNMRDPYLIQRKPPSPALCRECHAVFEKGRWRWSPLPSTALARDLCPACRRIRDRYPAGWVVLKGDFIRSHRSQILDIVRNEEKQEVTEHPMNRIMRIEKHLDGLLITTTDIHLPRLIGEALHRAHKGELRVRYDVRGYSVQVEWTRQSS